MSDNQEHSRWFLIGNIIENITTGSELNPERFLGAVGHHDVGRLRAAHHQQHDLQHRFGRQHLDTGRDPRNRRQRHLDDYAAAREPRADRICRDRSHHIVLHHNLLFGDPRMDWANGHTHPTAAQLAMVQSLTTDPQFVNAAGGDFHILTTSPRRTPPNSTPFTRHFRRGTASASRLTLPAARARARRPTWARIWPTRWRPRQRRPISP